MGVLWLLLYIIYVCMYVATHAEIFQVGGVCVCVCVCMSERDSHMTWPTYGIEQTSSSLELSSGSSSRRIPSQDMSATAIFPSSSCSILYSVSRLP